MKLVLALLCPLVLAACGAVGGNFNYARPSTGVNSGSSKVIDKPREAVWNTAVPQLGKQFFVINNLDKSSGLINVSYNGDPDRYIDCGRISSSVKNLQGERSYEFAAASAQQSYETMEPQGALGVPVLFAMQRKMTLDGRVNLIFEETGTGQTRVTANTRYVVNRQITGRQYGYPPVNLSDTISFNTSSSASFPPSGGRATECVSTGALEREILALMQ